MLELGKINRLEVRRTADFGMFLGNGEDEVLLPCKYVPAGTEIGNELEVFVYPDSEDRPVATTQKPKGMVGDTVFLEAVDVTGIGAFLDWGLDKDLFVPFKEQKEPMVKGRSYVVRIVFDRVSNRIFGSARLHVFARKTHENNFSVGDRVEILVCAEAEHGFSVLIDRRYLGMLYKSDLHRAVKVGETLPAYISRLRADRKIDVSLRKPGFFGIIREKPLILEKLREAGGFLPFNSKSSPEEIENYFQISKRVFKQAIGNLYKERRITVTADGIKLNCSRQSSR
ncbi:MAG: S1-like domain-containing RNA-binding protein [Victivallaceae bacterium]|nr:S1-like domain-containing RNA-binding protein [Victivallaceae bacterium]